jgi:DNA gyrase/topoisomerase IV subunit A
MNKPQDAKNDAHHSEHKAEKIEEEIHELKQDERKVEKEIHELEKKEEKIKEEIHELEEEAHEHEVTIIVNGKKREFKGKVISFDQVVILAFGSISPDPNMIYTVTYKKGIGHKTEGTMVKGDEVKVKDGMIFNVTATNKS